MHQPWTGHVIDREPEVARPVAAHRQFSAEVVVPRDAGESLHRSQRIVGESGPEILDLPAFQHSRGCAHRSAGVLSASDDHVIGIGAGASSERNDELFGLRRADDHLAPRQRVADHRHTQGVGPFVHVRDLEAAVLVGDERARRPFETHLHVCDRFAGLAVDDASRDRPCARRRRCPGRFRSGFQRRRLAGHHEPGVAGAFPHIKSVRLEQFAQEGLAAAGFRLCGDAHLRTHELGAEHQLHARGLQGAKHLAERFAGKRAGVLGGGVRRQPHCGGEDAEGARHHRRPCGCSPATSMVRTSLSIL